MSQKKNSMSSCPASICLMASPIIAWSSIINTLMGAALPAAFSAWFGAAISLFSDMHNTFGLMRQNAT